MLCTREELTRERVGWHEALSACTPVHLLRSPLRSIQEALQDATLDPGAVVALYPDNPEARIATDLAECRIPTACFHIDSFGEVAARARLARLYDLNIVFHPASMDEFYRRGVPQTLALPHAVRAGYFVQVAEQRDLEVSMIGRSDGPTYSYRRQALRCLETMGLRTNDFSKAVDYTTLGRTYLRTRIGVNIPQDHYLRDANLRCFEVMAAGALLLTPRPSELSDWGFVEDRHFIGFASLEEMRARVSHYLSNEAERSAIATAARQKVLQQFTYAALAPKLLGAMAGLNNPARRVRERRPRIAAGIRARHYARHADISKTILCARAAGSTGWFWVAAAAIRWLIRRSRQIAVRN